MARTAAERRASDDMGLLMLKFSLFGALLGVLAATVGDTAAGIVLFAAAAAALGWGWRKIITPLVQLSTLLEGLPAWMKKVDDWQEHVDDWHVEERMEALEQRAGEAADKADVAAGQADVAATRAKESVNVVRGIARVVGAQVRGEVDDGE